MALPFFSIWIIVIAELRRRLVGSEVTAGHPSGESPGLFSRNKLLKRPELHGSEHVQPHNGAATPQ